MKKKRKESERLKAEKAKSSSRPTAVMIRGLREKTFRKDFIRTHMEKYGEIVKISSGLHNHKCLSLTLLSSRPRQGRHGQICRLQKRRQSS